MKAALLADRGVVKVAGEGARNFLHGLVTADMLGLQPGEARFCALLSPQGKILADFLVTAAPAQVGGDFFLDCPRELCASLVERLNRYKLRAKVVVEDLSGVLGVLAAWNGTALPRPGGDEPAYTDPRLAALGLRLLLPPHRAGVLATALGATLVEPADYEAHRIALGVPRGGVDFAYGDAFPHETDMDQLAGVDFAKGCYVGQEVVSRMEHRGTARRRAVPVSFEGTAPPAGSPVTAAGRPLGTIGSAAGGWAIALLRLDRVAEALARGEPLLAADVPVHPVKPDWARFAVPDPGKAAE